MSILDTCVIMLRKGNALCILFFLSVFSFSALAQEVILGQIYDDREIQGTLVIASLDGSQEYVYNRSRSNKQFLPASTFKIPHTLMALEEQLISEADIIHWDGKDKGWDKWNKDQTLHSAFKYSCVWCFELFTEKINDGVYHNYLKTFNYGNKKTGSILSRFWLQGDLAISAREQIGFLRKLVNSELAVKEQSTRLLKAMMIEEQNPLYILRAKTGWETHSKEQIGWYVGYIETRGGTWLFAHNMNVRKRSDLSLRKSVVLKILQTKDIM